MLWGFVVTLVVLLAVYVSLGQVLTSMTGSYQQQILKELNRRAPFTIDARSVGAEWHSFTPVLILQDLRLTMPGASGRAIDLTEGRIGIDVASSLRTWSLQMTRLQLDGLQLSGELTEQGRLRIRGFETGESSLRDWAENYLLNLDDLVLSGIQLELAMPAGELRGFELELQLSRERSRRRLDAELRSSRGLRVVALGEGLGNPFKPDEFDGEFHLDIDIPEVGALDTVLVQLLPEVLFEGRLGMQVWSSWKRGVATAEVQLEVEEFEVFPTDQSWRVPLDRLAFDASLVDRGDRWDLFIADLHVVAGQTSLRVPRLQLNAWGETLRLRAMELPLEPLAVLVAGLEPVPPTAAEVVAALRPRGSLTALQVNVADISSLADGWDIQARFRQVAVESWRGAPGVTAASGFVEAAPGWARVLLDSQQFTMDFPTVYQQPLHYEELYGTIDVNWDPGRVTLASGLIQARAAEGRVPVMFGLSIPLEESTVGLEMDLLVGLENTNAGQRAKYIPYILDEHLLAWLEGSISAGIIEQGGFLWRGALISGAPGLNTVQLFFNVDDAALDYHPDWPAVTGIEGTVLINDGAVSVWADRASLLDSAVDSLSVEVWPDDGGRLRLAIDASLEGPAADGLVVVNGSGLDRLAGGAFSRWQLSGDASTKLNLAIDLGDEGGPPQVGVTTRFAGVDLEINPGELPVRNISGELAYSTAQGFSSTDLVGELWGRPLAAAVGQGAAGRRKRSAVTIDLASVVDIGDVRQWLGLELLGFASGRSAVTVQVVVPSGAPGWLRVVTDLDGISLDLPSPWGKPAGTHRQLIVDLAQNGNDVALGLELEGGLKSRLDLAGGGLRSAALAFGEEPVEPEAGVVRITGRAGRVDVAEWSRFIGAYLWSDPAGDDSREAGTGGGPGDAVPPLVLRVDQLQVAPLVVGGREISELEFDLAGSTRQWQLAARSGWLQGELLYVGEEQASQLVLHRLDLAGLPSGSSEGDSIVELPRLAVTIDDLRQGERALGNLAFDLRTEGEVLIADNITGDIVGLQLPATSPGRLGWYQGEGGHTELQASLHFTDLGQTLKQLGYQAIVATEEGEFDLALEWPGGPQEFSLEQSRGVLQVDVGKGRFLDAPPSASGTLRVVSILNLAEIVQRLSLSHMFEEGIPFDQVEGQVSLQEGIIEVAKMDVQGSSSSFQFSGTSTVASRSLDGELVVTLPVANNLPWVAALTAGLPVAAGVFVLSKVFEKQFNRLTSAVYGASGTWDDPKIKFERIFDDTDPAAVIAREIRSGTADPGAAAVQGAPVQPSSP